MKNIKIVLIKISLYKLVSEQIVHIIGVYIIRIH